MQNTEIENKTDGSTTSTAERQGSRGETIVTVDEMLAKASGSAQAVAKRFCDAVGGLSKSVAKKTAGSKRADMQESAKSTKKTARKPASSRPSGTPPVRIAVGSGRIPPKSSAKATRRKKRDAAEQAVLRKMSNTYEVTRAIQIMGIIARGMHLFARGVCMVVRRACRAIKNWFVYIKDNLPKARDWAKNNVRLLKFIALGVLACVYVLCSLVFSNLFMPGTTINGRDVSLKSADAAAIEVQEVAKGYTCTASGDGLDLDMRGADIDLTVDEDAYRNDASSCLYGWIWPIGLFLPHEHQISTGVTYSREKLQSAVRAAVDDVNEDATAPQDASIVYDDAKNLFVAKAEKEGTLVSCDSVVEAMEQRISALQERVVLGNDELVQPDLVASGQEMEKALLEANKVANLDIVLTVDDKEFDTLDKGLIRSWVVLDKGYSVKGNLEAVTAWAREDLSLKIDTINVARTYTRPNDGKRIEVFGGTYGWNVDSDKLAQNICKRMEEVSDDPIEIPMQSRGEVLVLGGQDWGPRYVDVDLTEQYVRMFDENSNIVMESECVSGNKSLGTETVTGVFTVEDKQSPMLLVGLDDDGDGEPDYENEVQYWMPFYGGYGLHDALWRGSFGGEAYQYDGSHGCVNLPYSAAEILYGYIKVGDIVVVHW